MKGDSCKIEDCDKIVTHSGRTCNYHRYVKRKFGDYYIVPQTRNHPHKNSRVHDQLNTRKNLFYSLCRFPNENGCIEWQGSCNSKGYGQMNVGLKSPVLASRYSYALHKGVFDAKLCVLHHCDNPKCVAPYHLFLGTKKDNSADCIKKGRHNWNLIKEIK